ncbi:ASPARTIC PROTEASE IN GUARD CELL 1 protein [Nymphaea thermarum]|nr:ASPARTIC PROTEASE IN GUARD CELL 1 protein [Nymphaea thermarum]
MGRRRLLPLFFCFLIAASSAVPLLYDSLNVRPLSRPPTLDSALPWSETLEATESTADSAASSSPSLVFRLEHRDSLALNSSAAELFSLRLDRDSARVHSIASRLAQQTHGRPLDTSGCSRRRSCLYQVSYGDGSSTVGDFSTETLTFGRTSIGRIALGCGHDNEGLFVGAAGLLGLGHGDLSFPSQVGRIFGRRFSYCLSDRQAGSTPSSTLIFGDAALPAPGRGAVFAPMVANPKLGTFYYVQLVGISVGGARVNVAASEFQISANGNGGVIVDSGTSVTRLVQPAYVAMRDAFRAGTTQLNRTTAGFSLFDTCYDLSGKDVVKVPTIVFHFGRGSDLSLPASNYLIPVNTAGLFCFAFAGTSSGLTIIGNIQQQGIRVVFDPVASRVGFVPHACG